MVTQHAPLSAAAPPTRLTRILATLGPDYTLFFVFFVVLLAIGLVYGANPTWREGPVLLAGGICIGLIVVRTALAAPAILRKVPGARARLIDGTRSILRDWGALLLVAIVFQNLETYTGLIRTTVVDEALYKIDMAVFGVEPTVWVSRFYNGVLTDWMALCYALYLPVPMVLATALTWRGRRTDFRELATAVMLNMCVGFLVFLIFPAGPPRYYDLPFDPPHISSFFGLYEYQQGAWDTADPLRTRSAFPSLHCSLGLITLAFSRRYGDAVFPRRPRLFFWICVPLVVSLWLSTIYLRHHWVPDIAAGLILGVISITGATWIHRVWPKPAT